MATSSVGVLGWLGFIIINFAAWGFISLFSSIDWIFGFIVCACYTLLLMWLANVLERRGAEYKGFANLLWVLAATFVLVLGVVFSFRVLDHANFADDGNGGSNSDQDNGCGSNFLSNDLAFLLPDNASEGLRTWAGNLASWTSGGPTFAMFAGSVLFSGRETSGTWVEGLWCGNGSSVSKVAPELRDASLFLEFQSSLFFASGNALWRVDSEDLLGAVLVKDVDLGVSHLFVDAPTSSLYFKGRFRCPESGAQVDTIFQSNGTRAGTVDLRGDVCCSPSTSTTTFRPGSTSSGKPSRGALWGVLFLGVVPMMIVASLVLAWKKMPGMVVNLFSGVLIAAMLIYELGRSDDDDSFSDFLKWFITIYTSALWVAIIAWSLRFPSLPAWLEELKTWAVAVVGFTFAIIVQVDIQVLIYGGALRWVAYALVMLLQLVFSAAVSRTVPMVFGAMGLFIVTWKIAFDIAEFVGFRSTSWLIVMLSIVLLQGIGVVMAGVFYASKRSQIDEFVQNSLTCRTCRKRRGESTGPDLA